MIPLKEIDKSELEANNGTNGRPLWVAYRGRVFDLTTSGLWAGGSHMGSHTAGGDLTEEIAAAPHGPEMLERFPEIGTLKGNGGGQKEEESSGREKAETRGRPAPGLLTRFPFLKRHPHPMTVHFPIVLGVFAPLFLTLYLIFVIPGFELTSFYCLGAGLFFIPVAMITGYITWRINYGGRPIKAVTRKMALSVVLFAVDAATFAWRRNDPGIIDGFSGGGIIYFILVFLLMPLVIIIGWYGATLTFPLSKSKDKDRG